MRACLQSVVDDLHIDEERIHRCLKQSMIQYGKILYKLVEEAEILDAFIEDKSVEFQEKMKVFVNKFNEMEDEISQFCLDKLQTEPFLDLNFHFAKGQFMFWIEGKEGITPFIGEKPNSDIMSAYEEIVDEDLPDIATLIELMDINPKFEDVLRKALNSSYITTNTFIEHIQAMSELFDENKAIALKAKNKKFYDSVLASIPELIEKTTKKFQEHEYAVIMIFAFKIRLVFNRYENDVLFSI